jgi:hypothetical protein
LFGEYNPSGKLAITVYPAEFVDQVPLTQMSVTQPPGRTYMYYNGSTEFTFGDGMVLFVGTRIVLQPPRAIVIPYLM